MKKIFLLSSGDYSDYCILGVFDTKKRAFKMLKEHIYIDNYTEKSDILAFNNLTLKTFKGDFWGFSIEEYPLNKLHNRYTI